MEDDFLYLVMEHLDGINIKDYLKTKGAFEPLLAAKLISEVCGALLEAHQKGIVHRDIKPGNIEACSDARRRHSLEITRFWVGQKFRRKHE